MLTSIPNLLTLSRILAIPVVVGLFYLDGAWVPWTILAIFILAAVTDYFDGLLARQMNEVTPLGRFLDPIADKLLVSALIVMLVADNQITGWDVIPAVVILCREILVSGLREYLAEIRAAMPVSRLAKWKTAIQMVALGVLIVAKVKLDPIPVQMLGTIGIWIAAALTLITGYDYLQRGLKHMTAD